jgi:hypothetical protein
MNTYDEQKAYFDATWDAKLRPAFLDGGAPALVAAINAAAEEGSLERRVLFLFARQGLMAPLESSHDALEAMAQVAEAGTRLFRAEATAAEEAGDTETAERRLRGAHSINYNLTADMADCWPGDTLPARTESHFQIGASAALTCLTLAAQLGSEPEMLAIDEWANGFHLLALGDTVGSVAALRRSTAAAARAAEAAGRTTEIGADSPFLLLLNSGYLAIAREAAGDGERAEAELAAVVAAFDSQIGAGEADGADKSAQDRAVDARFALQQLALTRRNRGLDAASAG